MNNFQNKATAIAATTKERICYSCLTVKPANRPSRLVLSGTMAVAWPEKEGTLSCRSCRPNAPFAELLRLWRTSVADEMREEHRRRVLGE